MGKALPVYGQPSGVLDPDGRRRFVVTADVQGRFTRRKNLFFALLIVIYVALPWLSVGGHPAVFLDIEHRSFYLFGATFNAQDFWMVFFLLSGVGFLLIFVTALWGRVWCGYACPQTVFLEGVFRRVERWIEGPRNLHLKRDRGPLTLSRVARKVVKHAAFLLLASLVAHVFLSYFVSLPAVLRMVRAAPSAHLEAFSWASGATLVMYVNFAWFREQLCLIVCPYGRLQSILTDSDSLVIGYDAGRGEPRGKPKATDSGDCVDCGRCVVVCPTGIDIRNGLQLECIGCAACIDACDEVMAKLGRPVGLIRYDSLNGLAGLARRFWRARLYVYAALGAVGLVVAALLLRTHTHFEANLLRLGATPYVLDASGSEVQNGLELHLVNKRGAPVTFHVTAVDAPNLSVVIGRPEVPLAALAEARVPVFVRGPREARGQRVRVKVDDGAQPRVIEAPFVAP